MRQSGRNSGQLMKRQQVLIRENRDLSTADLQNRANHINRAIASLEADVERFRALLAEAQTRLRSHCEEADVIQAIIDQRR
jgi:tellurite resistance protein